MLKTSFIATVDSFLAKLNDFDFTQKVEMQSSIILGEDIWGLVRFGYKPFRLPENPASV